MKLWILAGICVTIIVLYTTSEEDDNANLIDASNRVESKNVLTDEFPQQTAELNGNLSHLSQNNKSFKFSELNLSNISQTESNVTSKIRHICTAEGGCSPPLTCRNMSTLNNSNVTDIINQNKVVNVTSDQLQYILENPNFTNSCVLVFFYTVWCTYSMEFVPVYNVLAKHFPQMPVLAYDFGAQKTEKYLLAYVPRVLLYYSGRGVYNIETDMNSDEIKDILANMTGFDPLPISKEEWDVINEESPLPQKWEFDSTHLQISVAGLLLILLVHVLKRPPFIIWLTNCKQFFVTLFSKFKTD